MYDFMLKNLIPTSINNTHMTQNGVPRLAISPPPLFSIVITFERLPRHTAAEFSVTEGHAFVRLPQSANSMAVDVTGVLETTFIAGDHSLYLMQIRHKATQRRANCITAASRAGIVLQ